MQALIFCFEKNYLCSIAVFARRSPEILFFGMPTGSCASSNLFLSTLAIIGWPVPEPLSASI